MLHSNPGQGPDNVNPIPVGESPKDVAADFGLEQRVSDVMSFPDSGTVERLLEGYPEFAWLAGGVNATPEGLDSAQEGATLSERVFSEKHIEFDRTAVGVMVLRWVLEGDYESFTDCHPDGAKLTRESFEDLRSYTKSILPDSEAIDAMVTYMVINDLGKIKSVVEQVKSDLGVEDVDHDKILLQALEQTPEMAPSFERLSAPYKELIVNGLRAEFNIGQFIQGENVAASLSGLAGVEQRSLDFYLLHALCDIAGAAGHVKQNGALVMTEHTYQGFALSIKAMSQLDSSSVTDVYDSYLSKRAETLGLDISLPQDKALARVCCMLRVFEADQALEVKAVFESLSSNTQAVLVDHLNRNGVDNGIASVLYYSPATLANCIAAQKTAGSEHPFQAGLQEGLEAMARVYQEAAIATKKRTGDGVYTVMVSPLAEAAKTESSLGSLEFSLRAIGDDAELDLKKKVSLNARNFDRLDSLRQLPGKRVVVIGIGGGSDGIQAAQLADLLEREGKECPAVISVRTDKTASQNPEGVVGQSRTVDNHGGEIRPGVFKILPETSGSGRFLENLPADSKPVFLAIDSLDGQLTGQIEDIIREVGGADLVIGVDTGGDGLYSAFGQDEAKATPDQDLRVLQSMSDLSVPVLSCEIACGVDSPPNAEEVLLRGGAQYYSPTSSDTDQILANYERWQIDGTHEQRYGKTPYAWQAALNGEQGYTTIPLPENVVLDKANPWNPFVYVNGRVSEQFEGAMRGMFFMNLEQHLDAIGLTR